MENSKYKYVGFKLIGLNYWIWFEQEHVKERAFNIVAMHGWGLYKREIDITINTDLIEGRMYSNSIGISLD